MVYLLKLNDSIRWESIPGYRFWSVCSLVRCKNHSFCPAVALVTILWLFCRLLEGEYNPLQKFSFSDHVESFSFSRLNIETDVSIVQWNIERFSRCIFHTGRIYQERSPVPLLRLTLHLTRVVSHICSIRPSTNFHKHIITQRYSSKIYVRTVYPR